MTVLAAIRVFNGVACPKCKKKVTINFDSDTLFAPFHGFHNITHTNECCTDFHEELNNHIAMHVIGRTGEHELVEALSRYKETA